MKKQPFIIYFIFAVCAAWFTLWLVRLVQNITMPQIEYSEGLMLYNATAFAKSTWSWNITQPDGSYMVTYYTPLYYWIAGGLMNVFGYNLVVGRLLILFCFITACILVYLIVVHVTKQKIYALICALLPFCFTFTNVWSWFNRVDIMAVMFDLAGIFVALKFWRSRWLHLLSIPLFLLAFLTKQSVIAGFITITLALALIDWRKAVSFAYFSIVSIILVFGIGNTLTDNQFLNQIIFFQRTSPAFRDNFGFLMVAGYLETIPLLILSWQYIKQHLKNPLAIYAAVTILVSLVTIIRPGGAANYFFEPIFAMIIISACALPLVIKRTNFIGILFSIPLVFLVISVQLPTMPDSTYPVRIKEAQSLISDAKSPIVTDNFDLVIGAGKVPYYEPFVFSNLAHFGYWDGNILLNDLNTNRIPYVITQYPVGTDKVRRIDTAAEALIMQNYHVVLDYSDQKYNPTFVVYKANK